MPNLTQYMPKTASKLNTLFGRWTFIRKHKQTKKLHNTTLYRKAYQAEAASNRFQCFFEFKGLKGVFVMY